MPNSIQIALRIDKEDAQKAIRSLEMGVIDFGKTGTRSLVRVEKQVNKTGIAFDTLKGFLGAQLILSGLRSIRAGFVEATGSTLEFGKNIAEINSIVPRTSIETIRLKRELIGLSNLFGDDVSRQARAYYNILSAGITQTAQATSVLTSANKASVAGITDVDTAARGLISVINSYADGSIDAERASDILFSAVREGRTTFGELAETIGRVSSISSTAGINFSEIAGTLAFVTKSGITTDEAVIGLRNVLTSIIGPTDSVKKRARELGIEFSASALRTKQLSGIFNELREATGGNIETLRELFPNVRGFSVVAKIAGTDLKDFNRILGETSNSVGATDKALRTITDSASFQFQKLIRQLKNFPIAILTNFEEPLSEALKTVNDFVSKNGVILIADALDIIIQTFSFFDKAITISRIALMGIRDDFLIVYRAMLVFDNYLAKLANSLAKFFNAKNAVSNTEKSMERLKVEIDALTEEIKANDTATKGIVATYLKREKAARAFREKIRKGREKQVEDNKNIDAQQLKNDEEAASDSLKSLVGNESDKFDVLAELRLGQIELERQEAEQAKIEKELGQVVEFERLVDGLGREQALRELYKIKQINSESGRIKQIANLQIKAAAAKEKMDKEAARRQTQLDIATSKAKIGILGNTARLITAITGKESKAGFLITQATGIAESIINTQVASTAALPNLPLSGLIQIKGNLATAAIIAQTVKGYQGGGLIDSTSTVGDRNMIGANGGEVMLNKRQQLNLFNSIDRDTVGRGGGTNINIYNPSFLNQEGADSIIDAINDRLEFGNKRIVGI